MSPAGRPQKYPVKKLIHIDQELLDAVEAFRAEQSPIPNQSEAIRTILRKYLVSYGALDPDTDVKEVGNG